MFKCSVVLCISIHGYSLNCTFHIVCSVSSFVWNSDFGKGSTAIHSRCAGAHLRPLLSFFLQCVSECHLTSDIPIRFIFRICRRRLSSTTTLTFSSIFVRTLTQTKTYDSFFNAEESRRQSTLYLNQNHSQIKPSRSKCTRLLGFI